MLRIGILAEQSTAAETALKRAGLCFKRPAIHRFTVWPIQPTDPACFFALHSTSRETKSASLRSSVVVVIIMSSKHSEARHGEDASDRCGRTDPGKGRRDHRLRCSRCRDQSVVLRAEEARLDRAHFGASCRGCLSYG